MAAARRPLVAIIDLDDAQEAFLSDLLSAEGCKVATFRDVAGVVAAYISAPPDIVITRVDAPDLEGWRTCRLLRSPDHAKFNRTPILLLSTNLTGDQAWRCSEEAGGDCLLPFSVDPELLLKSARQLLSRQGEEPEVDLSHQDLGANGFERSYEALFAHMLDGCALHEMIFDEAGRPVDYRFLAVNSAFAQMTGQAATAVIGKTVLELWPDTESDWIENYGRVAITGEPFRFENYHAGLRKHFEVVAFRPAPGQFACVFTDTTERVAHQEEIGRLTRLYAVLSQINQSVVRAGSREELFGEVCRIFAEFGHFGLTWIGITEPASGHVELVAKAAYGQEFPAPVRAKQCRVVHDAMARNQAAVCNTLSPEQSAADCHEKAREFGIGACAAFPIQFGNSVCGALCVHSTEAEFFNDSEVKLLEESALDISFALDKFEADAERERVVAVLRESERKFSTTFQSAPVMMTITTLQEGSILEVNEKLQTSLGFGAEFLVGKTFVELGISAPEDRQRILASLSDDDKSTTLELVLRCRDGHVMSCEYAGQVISIDGRACILSSIADVTDRKQHESERLTMLKLLRLLNAPNGHYQLIQEVTGLLQEWSGCEAVGVRLQRENDFPYFETRGFPPEFVQAESCPCARDSNGDVLRASDGSPVLECMCGHVLRGRFDPTQPLFTESGSFWTNSNSAVLASTSEAERQSQTRNRCHGAGYESVALIPLRAGGRTLGLIQLNDHRPGRFTPDVLNLLERAAGSLAMALDQRNTLEALHSSRERYRLVADHTYDWEFWIGPGGEPLYHSPSCERITGYSAAEFIADPELLEKIIHAEDLERYRRYAGGEMGWQAGSLEFRIRTRRGAEATLEQLCQGMYGEHGDFLGRRGNNRDITERKRAETALDQSNLRLQLAAVSGSLGIWEWDAQSDALVWNDRMFELYDVAKDQFSGRAEAWLKVIHPDDRMAAVEAIATTLEGCGPYDQEYRVLLPSGAVRHIKADGLVIRDGDGAALRMIGLNRDVSGAKHAAEERERLQAQLTQAQKMESIGRLAGGVAHDFNNLLTVINGYSSQVLQKLGTGDAAWQPLNEIHRAGERAAELTKQLLAFSRKQVIEPASVDLNQLILDDRDFLERLIGENIEIVIENSRAPAMVFADVGNLHQVLLNLAVNARDAMPGGGRLCISIGVGELDHPVARMRAGVAPSNYVVLSVADTGIGMDEEVLQHLFEPFFTTKDPGKGTGLGLSTVYGIVQQSGGWIEVQSQPGQGATFRVCLPQWAGTEAGNEPRIEPRIETVRATPAQQDCGLTGSETILIVEDQEEVRDFVAAALTSYGYDVRRATNGIEALSLIEGNESSIDMVLSDIVMPGLGGRELARRLNRLYPQMPVLLMSGYSGEMVDEEVLDDASADYLPKPFTPQALALRVRKALGSKTRPRESARRGR